MFHSRQFMKICSKQSCACTWVCWGMSLHEALSHLCHGTTTPTRDVLSESAQLTKMGEKSPANSLFFCQIWLKSITEKPGHMLFQTFGLIEDELIRNTSQVFWAKLRMSLELEGGKNEKKKKGRECKNPNNLSSCADSAIKPNYRYCNHFKGRKGWGLHCAVHWLWSANSSCSQQIGTLVLLELFFFPSKYTFKSNSCK